jgi:hypothetical protein
VNATHQAQAGEYWQVSVDSPSMNEILELQPGQVSFISGLMATLCFVLFTVSSLLFLVGLYIDVALSLRIAGLEHFPAE